MTELFTLFASFSIFRPEYNYILLIVWVIIVSPLIKGKVSRTQCFMPLKSVSFVLFIISSIFIASAYFVKSDDSSAFLAYLIIPILIFISGYSVIINANKDSYCMVARRVVYAVLIGCGIHALLNFLININSGVGRFEITDFFTGAILSATNQATMNIFIFSIVPCLFLFQIKKIEKMILIVLLGISMMYGFMLGARTSFVIMLINIFIVGILFVFKSKKKIVENKLTQFMMVFPVAILIIYILFMLNVGGIKDIVEGTNLMQYIQNSTTSLSDLYRFTLFSEGVENLFSSAIGPHSSRYAYYHNYWLDMGRVAGYIPVLTMISSNIILSLHSYQLLKKHNDGTDKFLCYMLFSLVLGSFLNFAVEPILDGYHDFYYRFILVFGVIEGIYKRNRIEKKV